MTVIMSNLNRFKHFLQERGGLMHFARMANTPLKVEESAQDNHVLACNFAMYFPI